MLQLVKKAIVDKGILQVLLDKQYQLLRTEDIAYKGAYLAKLRQKIERFRNKNKKYPDEEQLNQLEEENYREMNLLETFEHWEISKGDILEQSYTIFNALHKICRNREIVLNRRYEELSKATDIVDPNKFPIFSLIDRSTENDIVSIFSYKPEIMEMVHQEVGFSLEIKQSTIEHHEAGDGVFVKLFEDHKIIPGKFLGFVPGVIYNPLEKIKHEQDIEKNFFQGCDGTVIDYSAKLPYPFKLGYSLLQYHQMNQATNLLNTTNYQITEALGEYINPYAVGHKVNHPPPNIAPNIALIDCLIPPAFFPLNYMRYFPYIRYSVPDEKTKDKYSNYHGLAMIALEELKDGQELFFNYLDMNQFPYNNFPDWLIDPPPLSPYLTKYEYDHSLSFFGKFIDMYLESSSGDPFEKLKQKISHDPQPEQRTKIIQNKINAAVKNKKN